TGARSGHGRGGPPDRRGLCHCVARCFSHLASTGQFVQSRVKRSRLWYAWGSRSPGRRWGAYRSRSSARPTACTSNRGGGDFEVGRAARNVQRYRTSKAKGGPFSMNRLKITVGLVVCIGAIAAGSAPALAGEFVASKTGKTTGSSEAEQVFIFGPVHI